jgi:quinol monooxygenase YgiN
VIPTGREIFIDVEPGIRIRFRRSEPPPPVSYAITLESREDGEWMTVSLWDNADAVDEHHEHEHTKTEGKQAATILDFDSPNEAMAAAISKAKLEALEIVRQWRES